MIIAKKSQKSPEYKTTTWVLMVNLSGGTQYINGRSNGAIFTKNLQDAKRFRSEPDAKRYAKALTLGSGAALVPRKVVRSIALQ
mgnify:FL=1